MMEQELADESSKTREIQGGLFIEYLAMSSVHGVGVGDVMTGVHCDSDWFPRVSPMNCNERKPSDH